MTPDPPSPTQPTPPSSNTPPPTDTPPPSLACHPERSEGPASLPQSPTQSSDPDPLHSPAPLAPPDPAHAATPLCPHFGPCGGCQLQHLTYPAQLETKRTRLLSLLSETSPHPLPTLHTHTADPWRYRNRIRIRLEPTPKPSPTTNDPQPTTNEQRLTNNDPRTTNTNPPAFHIGYNHASSNTFLPIHTCPIAAPLLLRAALALSSLSSPDALPWLHSTAELELFTLPDESRLQLTLHLRSGPDLPSQQHTRSFTRLCEALQHHIPELAGAGATLLRPHHTNSTRTRAARRSTFYPVTWGAPGLLYPVPLNPDPASPAETLWVSRPSFFQINRHLLPTLVHLATTAAAPHNPRPTNNEQRTATNDQRPTTHEPRLFWDLFAGVGLFTRALAPHATRIVAVESAPTSTADLAAARLPNARIVTSTVLDFLRAAVLDRDRPALVLLDPPRAGLGLEATALLTRIAPARIVYVSCDPESLSRDLRAMLSSGYNLAELHLVDLFPQTVHLETVAVLDRS